MVTTTDITARALTFFCREAGEPGAEPVILLHGFPETSPMWRPLMERLAAAGYRCLAPDQRGYSPGARPQDVEAYRYSELGADVLALADAWSPGERFHLVGHDWGALVGWVVVDQAPERIASWTALSIAHPRAFEEATYADPGGDLYRGFLQVAVAPGNAAEAGMLANDLAALRGVWASSTPEQVAEYVRVFSQPGAFTAALNYYRASRAHKRTLDDPAVAFGPVDVPTLLIWGEQDPYCRRMSVELGAPYMKGEYRVATLPAGHWLMQEQEGAVADEVLSHLRAHSLR